MDVYDSYIDVIYNLEVSIIFPVYDDSNYFEYLIRDNIKYYKQNGVEVLVPFSNLCIESALLSIIKKYNLINWVLIKVENNHKNISLIEIAIQYASKKFILLTSIESAYATNVPYALRLLLNHYPKSYAVVNSLSYTIEEFACPLCILVEKQYIDRVYISFELKAKSLLNLSFSLDRMRLNKIVATDALFGTDLNKQTNIKFSDFSNLNFSNKTLSRRIKNYRIELGELVYDWKNNIYSEEFCLEYLKSFDKHWIKDNAFNGRYEKIILCQSYNETEFITEFLENMGIYFDGIILLDDGSKDDTYQKAVHDKILIKIKKKHEGFNDFANFLSLNGFALWTLMKGLILVM